MSPSRCHRPLAGQPLGGRPAPLPAALRLVPLRVYAFLNRLPADHSAKFFYSSTEDIESHRMKLNVLADVIRFAAEDPDDILVFIDGDAIPIAPLDPFLDEHLRRHDLAVQRLENEDPLPHPSFCATRVGFWHEIGGDWYKDYAKQSRTSRADPDGGNLLRVLRERQADWHPLLRSNRHACTPCSSASTGTWCITTEVASGRRRADGRRSPRPLRRPPSATWSHARSMHSRGPG